MNPTTSVVLTGTSPECLRLCLTRLQALDPAPDEVIIINNERIAGFTTQEFPEVKLAHGEEPASIDARGDVVVFIRDDGVFDRDWLGQLLAPYADPDVMGVGGRVVTGVEGHEPAAGDIGRILPNGHLTGNFGANPGRVIEVDHLPASHMSVRRTALKRLITGDSIGSTHLDSVALLSGAFRKLIFQPRAVVRYATDVDAAIRERSDPQTFFSQRRDHLILLIRAFGGRHPLVRNYARTTLREQDFHVRRMASRMGAYRRNGERRTLLTRARSVTALGGPGLELAGLIAGLPAGLRARSLDLRHTSPASSAIETGAIRTRTLRLSEVNSQDEQRWAALSAAALEPNPFLDPRFIMTAHRTWETTDDIRLVVAETKDRWLAVVPLSDIGRFGCTPLHLASTADKFLGERSSLCVPLVDRSEPTEALTAVLRHLSSSRSGLPGLIELTLLPADGPVATALRECCRTLRLPLEVRSRFTRAFAHADAGIIAPEHFSSNRRKQLRRKQRSLERLIGAPVEYIDHGPDPAALEALLTLEAAGWKSNRGSIKTKGKEQEWFNRYMQDFLAAGDCRVLELRARDVTLHMSLVLILGRVAFGTIDAYNEDYRDQSPGVIGRVLEQQTLLARDDIDAFDPCLHPKYTDSTALYPGSQDLLSVLIGTRPSARALLAIRSAARLTRFRSTPASQRP